jgi:hypothetical protein
MSRLCWADTWACGCSPSVGYISNDVSSSSSSILVSSAFLLRDGPLRLSLTGPAGLTRATSSSSSTRTIPLGLATTLLQLELEEELLLELLLELELVLELSLDVLLLLLLPQFDSISTCCSSAAVGSSNPKSESNPVPVFNHIQKDEIDVAIKK